MNLDTFCRDTPAKPQGSLTFLPEVTLQRAVQIAHDCGRVLIQRRGQFDVVRAADIPEGWTRVGCVTRPRAVQS